MRQSQWHGGDTSIELDFSPKPLLSFWPCNPTHLVSWSPLKYQCLGTWGANSTAITYSLNRRQFVGLPPLPNPAQRYPSAASLRTDDRCILVVYPPNLRLFSTMATRATGSPALRVTSRSSRTVQSLMFKNTAIKTIIKWKVISQLLPEDMK
jgi:hypothetical protein